MKIKVSLGIGFHNANQEDVIEVDDDLTDDEIEAEVQAWADNFIDIGWERVEE